MKTNGAFNHITIDTAKLPRSKFGLNHDVNTTASIGDTQPICCRLLIPKSKTTLSQRHIIRMAPMVCPTFGRLKAKIWSHFVSISDLLPRSAAALLTKSFVSGSDGNSNAFVPSDYPYMSLCDLSAMVLVGCNITTYFHQPFSSESADDSYTRWRSYEYDSTAQEVSDYYGWISQYRGNGTVTGFDGYNGGKLGLYVFGTQFGTGNQTPYLPFYSSASASYPEYCTLFPKSSQSAPNTWPTVELSSADYVIRRTFTQSGRTHEIAFAIRLSAFGKRIRKILIGLGYQINFASATNVNVLPVLAYFKAYFDTFGLTLYQNWESCAANSILTGWDNGYHNTMDWSKTFFREFVYDLGSTFVTEDQDFISALQSADQTSPSSTTGTEDLQRGFLNNIVLDTPTGTGGVAGISQVIQQSLGPNSPVSVKTGHVYINRVNHTEVDAQLLKTLYKWTNRQTIAGKRIKELLIAGGYGDYVKECKSNFIGYEELEIDVADVNATADSTNSVTGHNSVVGEYVGKGIGVTKGDARTVSFENDDFGYWVSIFAICPDAGWCQGLDPVLLATDADHMYNADFDGKGYELTPKTTVVGGTDWSQTSDANEFAKSLGMSPRHSIYKVAHNILNGDFSLRGVRDSYQPFCMDKIMRFGDRDCALSDASTHSYVSQKTLDVSDIPIAGNAWRYLNRYAWLSNFERIFTMYESDAQAFLTFVRDMRNVTNFELYYQKFDHFICMNMMNLVTYAPMLPISDSYGTTDDNDGHGDKTFTKA